MCVQAQDCGRPADQDQVAEGSAGAGIHQGHRRQRCRAHQVGSGILRRKHTGVLFVAVSYQHCANAIPCANDDQLVCINQQTREQGNIESIPKVVQCEQACKSSVSVLMHQFVHVDLCTLNNILLA